MPSPHYEIRAEVWVHPGIAGWHFITLDKRSSAEITSKYGMHRRGWGSLPVVVTVGATTWRTSIFPDKTSGGYVLPLKADVRKKENIVEGKRILLSLNITP